MYLVDGFELPKIEMVIGVDLSLTGPGIAAIPEPWGFGGELARASATTLTRVPGAEDMRGLVLQRSASHIAKMAQSLAARADGVLVVMEALLLQSGTGKAPERAAFWWMVRAELERIGFAVTSVHPTTRRSLAHDPEAVEMLKRERGKMAAAKASMTKKEIEAEKRRLARLGKLAGLQSQRRRWPGVILPDDNAADALVCAELGARALGWESLPEQKNKNLPSAIRALGIEKRKAA